MSSKPKKLGISIENISYYFDSVERGRMDAGGLNRKAGEWLALRSKLLKLPESTFEVVIRSVHSLVDNVAGKNETEETDAHKISERRKAVALFERVAQADSMANASGSSLGAAEKISF